MGSIRGGFPSIHPLVVRIGTHHLSTFKIIDLDIHPPIDDIFEAASQHALNLPSISDSIVSYYHYFPSLFTSSNLQNNRNIITKFEDRTSTTSNYSPDLVFQDYSNSTRGAMDRNVLVGKDSAPPIFG